MYITIIAATSKDGYIAGPDGDLSWTSKEDKQLLHDYVLKSDVLIMGQVTYPKHTKPGTNDNKLRVVLTHDPKNMQMLSKNTQFVNAPLSDVLKDLKSKGYKNALILGGASVYNQAISNKLADTLLISVEPITLGSGLPLYSIPLSNESLTGYKQTSVTPLNLAGTELYQYNLS